MNYFKDIKSLAKERSYFKGLSREAKRQYLIEFDMPPKYREYVEYEKISDYTLCVVFDEISLLEQDSLLNAVGF
ncbi:MAG: hypothetical protein ACON43_07300 [Flavobacteriaceae bacterium]